MFIRVIILALFLTSFSANASFNAIEHILSSDNVGQMEERCLAANIYFESRNEDVKGQWAVANVTLNRVAEKSWPDSICEVVFENWQFSWVKVTPDKTVKNRGAWIKALAISKSVLEEVKYIDLTHGSTHYHADYISKPKWAYALSETIKIGRHVFYK